MNISNYKSEDGGRFNELSAGFRTSIRFMPGKQSENPQHWGRAFTDTEIQADADEVAAGDVAAINVDLEATKSLFMIQTL